ncbi:beta-ketoacyl synthase N-terminal-like domain-containing protein [Kutzneria sp. NPDC052558]|uniref:beta-ketoacyl synthase N-terminal-like domain-containing protein n=1 Tax=Kutzneria sp. NPDC052558 TaxID=3364121 RepID=UPI0037CCAE77
MSTATVRAAAVLTPTTHDLDGFAGALFADKPLAEPHFIDVLHGSATRCLDAADARHARRVAARSATPAQTAAVVALRCVREAALSAAELSECALIVAGNNLAMRYQARTVLDDESGARRVRPTHAVTHLDTDVIGVVSELLDLRAEGWTVGAASASGAVAVIQAMRLLALGAAPRCLVVAPAAELSDTEIRALRASGALHPEPDAVCRPFDELRQGFVPRPAAAAVVLEPAEQGLAVLLGAGQRLDARRGAAPDRSGQAAAMRSALAAAGLSPADIGYVNAHATGSEAGDRSEADALAEVFGIDSGPLVNSSKGLLGHALSAAGLVELIASVVQLRQGRAHSNAATTRPMAGIGGRLIGRDALPLDRRVAMTNSFGFSGVNAAIVLADEGEWRR